MNSVIKARVTLTLEIPLSGVFSEDSWTLKSIRVEAQRGIDTALAHVSKQALGSAIKISQVKHDSLVVYFADKEDL